MLYGEKWMHSVYRAGKAVLPKWVKIIVNRRIQQRIDVLPEPVRVAIRNLSIEIQIARMVEYSAKSFKALRDRNGLKVQLGCGRDIKLGWVNIDLARRIPSGIDLAAHSDTILIGYDLRRGLPLEEGSCDIIYSEHFFEHLEYRYGIGLMRDCYRALCPGGIFRIVLPNMKGCFDAYLRGDSHYFDLIDIFDTQPKIEPGTDTLIDQINYGVYQHGEHKWCYDEEKLVKVLQWIGYSSVISSSYQKEMDSDEPTRLRYSFYMEAIK